MEQRIPSYPYEPKIKHEIHLSKSTWIGIGILFVGLVIVAASLIMNSDNSAKKLLDLKVDVLNSFVEKGSSVEFNVDILNFGTENRYDVTLSYNLLDSEGKIIKFKTETAAVETRASLKSSVKVPADVEDGDYVLKVIAEYGGNIATASDSFSVSEEVQEGVSEPEQESRDCDDNNKCTRDVLREDRCVHEAIVPCCGNRVCEAGENYVSCLQDCPRPAEEQEEVPLEPVAPDLERARQLAQSNPQSAISYCNRISKTGECYTEVAKVTKEASYCADIMEDGARDDCYSAVAEKASKSEICKEITSDSKKDVCYTNFVTNGDYTVCEELTLKYLKDSCNQLKMLDELQNK